MTTEYLLIREVASICRAPVGTVRHWIRTDRLPSIRPGRRRLVRRADLERFLAQNEAVRVRPEGT